MSIFPTWYSTKSTPIWTDVVWSSDGLTNFNLTVASIALYALTNSTTDNLTEWSVNKYYSDSLVDANSTVQSKADKTNVLEKDNTTPYTPTLPYHPVTKDYADNMTIPDASETVKGKIQIADTSEANLWLDDTKAMTPKKVSDIYWKTFTPFVMSNNTEYTANDCPVIIWWVWNNSTSNSNLRVLWYFWEISANNLVAITVPTSSTISEPISFNVPKWYKYKIQVTSNTWIASSNVTAYPIIT